MFGDFFDWNRADVTFRQQSEIPSVKFLQFSVYLAGKYTVTSQTFQGKMKTAESSEEIDKPQHKLTQYLCK